LQNSIFQLDSSSPSFYGQQPQQNQAIANTNGTHCSVDPLDSSLCQNLGINLPSLNGFNEGGSQVKKINFFYKLKVNSQFSL
jgi:hypothetical protein